MTLIKTYHIIDLFAGAGGLSLGFRQTGRISIVAAAELAPHARKTYKRNFKIKHLYSDVRTIDYTELQNEVGAIDIVIGGPPCQGFSNANRQHTSIINMNNRLVKEYVRAICELQPTAFIMENVAMLRSEAHRFIVDESDLDDDRIMGMNLKDERIEILPAKGTFEGAPAFIKDSGSHPGYIWAEAFYKTINTLHRFRSNQEKFDLSLEKHRASLLTQLKDLHASNHIAQAWRNDASMAETLISYMEQPSDFADTIQRIETSLLMQRALRRMKELADNNIHIFDYHEEKGAIVASVRTYSIRDYIKTILEGTPYGYTLYENTLNALHYGAPQKRERFILVGLSKRCAEGYVLPKKICDENNCRTVRDAIGDLESITSSLSVDSDAIELQSQDGLPELTRTLRGKLLYNHVSTATTDTALSRFKALKEGQNFHDLDPILKTTYSNAERTQNTIYMRLRYNEPCGTVVNVRKSMWIHPVLDRAISIREAARLQTFPDSFIFEGTKDAQYQQVGNAVPPFLARALAQSLIDILDRNADE